MFVRSCSMLHVDDGDVLVKRKKFVGGRSVGRSI